MKEINISNPQVTTRRLINALERESEGEARALLNTIKKQAYNRQYRLKQKVNDLSLTPIERSIIEKQYRQAMTEYQKVSESVAKVRSSFNNKSQRLTQAVNTLNINLARNEARKVNLQELQKQAKTVIGVSTLNVAVNNKMGALFEHYVYNVNGANIPSEMFEYINTTLSDVIGFDFKNAVADGFTRLQSFSSDELYETLVDVSQGSEKVIQQRATDLTPEEKEQINNVLYMLNSRNLL